MKIILIVCYLSCLFLLTLCQHKTEAEILETVSEKVITYGSVIRMQNVLTKYFLNSNKLTWGTGSKRQAVTVVRDENSYDGLWLIKEAYGRPVKPLGTEVVCGDIIRLEHINTQKNLHTHLFRSFITHSQEVCGFGNGEDSDENDNWELNCYGAKGELKGNTQFLLKHVGTGQFLYVNLKTSLFDEYNCRNCPIQGHREVSATEKKDKQALWKIVGGLMFNQNTPNTETSS